MPAALGWLTPRRLILLGAVVAAVVVVIVLLWYFLIRSDAPPPASIEAAVESVRTDQQAQQQAATQPQQAQAQEQPQAEASTASSGQQAADEGAAQQQQQAGSSEGGAYGDAPSAVADESAATSEAEDTEAPESQSADAEPPAAADLVGTWVLSERGESFVGYRIGEVLANVGTATAVGRTGEITATLEFDGQTITAVEIVADLRTLKSDQGFRDGALKDRGIESNTYPFATFVLTEAISIDIIPTGENPVSVTVAGTLELHGVTNEVQIELAGQYVDGLVVVSGSTEIVLLDYGIEAPVGFRVLSIEESGQMEFQIVFERSP